MYSYGVSPRRVLRRRAKLHAKIGQLVVGRKRTAGLMAKMGLSPIYQKPLTSAPHPQHPVYLYLLKGLVADRASQV